MHRFSASISSLRGGNEGKKGAATSPPLHGVSEFGGGGGSGNSGGLPPIPQDNRRQQQQQQHHQRRQSLQQPRQSVPSSSNPRRQSLAPSSSLERPQSTSTGSNAQQVRSPTAGLHSLPACAQLLNARKVYKAGYVWRLDGHPSSSPTGTLHPASSSSTTSTATPTSPRLNGGNNEAQQPHFVRYYMRLEDCILCLWPDEGLKQAQAQGSFIHPTSMNLQDGFVALADTKREWQARAEQCDAPTPFLFVLNTAGNNSVTFATENEIELRRWINTIRLSIWERQRLENLYTAARLGIKEEQQLRPIRSAISLSNNGAKIGRAEGLLDVRLPGDTEWKRVYAVLTEPGNYKATLVENGGGRNGSPANNSPSNGLPSSTSSTSLASAAGKKKEKRKSFMSSLFGGPNADSSSNASSSNAFSSSSQSNNETHSSPVIASYNTQLEDPNVGPTLALFGILSSTPSPTSPNLRSSRDFSSSTSSQNASSSASNTAALSSLPSNALKLTRRPLCVVNQVWSAYAVWPESEALIPHARTFKLHGRMTWLEQEVLSYSQASNSTSNLNNATNATHTRSVSGTITKDPMLGFEEAMRKENKDLGKADNQVQLLCMLVGNESDANLPGPSHAVSASYKGDTGAALLSWILGFYDAFRLHGRPDRMLYDPRNPLSSYFAQPAGPARGALYFDPPLVEDLPQFQDNHPRIINDGFMRILVDRMMRALGGNPSMMNGLQQQQQISADDIEAYRREGLRTSQRGTPGSSGSTPPVLPPIGESQGNLMGGSNSGRSTPTNPARNATTEKLVPQPPLGNQGQQMYSAPPVRPYADEGRSSPGMGATATPPIGQSATGMMEGRSTSRDRSPMRSDEAYIQNAPRPFLQGSQVGHEGRGSPRSNYGTPSPHKQQSSVNSSPSLQAAGMLRPGSTTSSSDANRNATSGHSPYMSEREGSGVDIRRGGDSRSGYAPSNDDSDQQESLRGNEEGGGSTDLSYYNSRKVRSGHGGGGVDSREATPAPSSRAPSALSSIAAVPPMPGQYIPTPDLSSSRQLQHQDERPHNANASMSFTPQSRAPAALEETSPHRHEQTLQLDNSVEDSSSQGIEGTSTTAAMGSLESSRSSAPSDQAGHGGLVGVDRGDRNTTQHHQHHNEQHQQQHDTALFDELGALYAMSLADDPHTHQMSRDPSSTASGHTQNSLNQLIMNRASVANNAPPPSDRSDSLAMSDSRTATYPSRENTYASSGPISAAPTSASEYSQTGTMAESLAGRSGAPSRSASQHLQQSQQQPSNLSKQISNTSSSHSSRNGLPNQSHEEPRNEARQSKASTVSTVPSEGQDDYLAALSYVALAENQEEPPTPRMANNGKPVISIQTSPQARNSSTSKTRQPYSSTSTEPSSAASPTYDEPLSPDPYGTYAEPAADAPKMRVINASPEKKSSSIPRSTSSDKSRQASMTSRSTSASRKPGRGVPRVQKRGKRLGTWSSDEDDDDDDDKDSIDEEEEAERKKAEEDQRRAAEMAAIAEAERYKNERQREERPSHLRESTASSGGGSLRRSLPGLPGPSTDPYLNRTTSPPSGMYPSQGQQSPYAQDMHQQQQQQYAQYDPTRGSMYGWPNQMNMSINGGSMMSPPWQSQHQHRLSAGGRGSPYNPGSPYEHSPSPSAYNAGQAGINNQNTMLAYMPDNPETAAADGKVMRDAAVAQHGLLQTGIEQKQSKSAAQQEALAKETGGPLLQLEHKAQMPQGGLVGAIASHERDRKRDGGLGATLTERDRERRMAEARQREMDQMGQRQPVFGGPGFGMPGFGGMMPGMGMGGYNNAGTPDPVQMQQQIAMLAAQNAYLQAMAGFNQGGLMGNQGNFMTPPFSPHMGGYAGGGPGSQAPYAGSYMGMAPPSQSPNQFQPGQEGYGRGSPGASGDPRHGRQVSKGQSDFYSPR